MELFTAVTILTCRAQKRTSGYKIFVCVIFSILIHFSLLIQEGAVNSFQIRLHFSLNLKVILSFFSFSSAAQNIRYKIKNEKYCTAVSQLCSATESFRVSQLMQLKKKGHFSRPIFNIPLFLSAAVYQCNLSLHKAISSVSPTVRTGVTLHPLDVSLVFKLAVVLSACHRRHHERRPRRNSSGGYGIAPNSNSK